MEGRRGAQEQRVRRGDRGNERGQIENAPPEADQAPGGSPSLSLSALTTASNISVVSRPVFVL